MLSSSKFESIFLICLLMIYPVYSTFKNAGPTSEDWRNYHAVAIDCMKSVDCGYYEQFPRTAQIETYPKLFHTIMIFPYTLLGGIGIKYIQILLFAAVLFSLYFYSGIGKLPYGFPILSGLILTNSIFNMYYSALWPQTLDLIIFPISLYFYREKKYMESSIGITALLYNHFAGAIYFSILFIAALIDKRHDFLKWLGLAFFVSMPVIQTYYIETLFLSSSGIWITQEVLWYMQPLNFFIFNGMTIVLLPLTAWYIFKHRKADKYLLIWIICFLPFALNNPFRIWTFILPPLMLLEMEVLDDVLHRRYDTA